MAALYFCWVSVSIHWNFTLKPGWDRNAYSLTLCSQNMDPGVRTNDPKEQTYKEAGQYLVVVAAAAAAAD